MLSHILFATVHRNGCCSVVVSVSNVWLNHFERVIYKHMIIIPIQSGQESEVNGQVGKGNCEQRQLGFLSALQTKKCFEEKRMGTRGEAKGISRGGYVLEEIWTL